MARLSCMIRHLWQCAGMLCTLILDATRWLRLCLRSPTALAAENLFLRKQLALYQQGQVKPRRATDATRCTLIWLSRWFDWRQALMVVQPETFMRWRRQGLRLFRPWTSRPGRPPIPVELQGLIRQMARDNLIWGQRRIANELRLKLGLRVSPRTVHKYLPRHLDRTPGHRVPTQRWRAFVRNHAWDFIVRGVAADLTRHRHVLCARIIQIVQGWWNRSVASNWQRTPPRDTTRLQAVMRPCSWSRHPNHIGRHGGCVSCWCGTVWVEQGQPPRAGRRAPEPEWQPGRSMASSGMTKRPDELIAHHKGHPFP
jgi:putative transposase